MEFTLTTPTLLFSAISLLFLAYTNRYLALASLIRELHKQYKETHETIIAAPEFNNEVQHLGVGEGLRARMRGYDNYLQTAE